VSVPFDRLYWLPVHPDVRAHYQKIKAEKDPQAKLALIRDALRFDQEGTDLELLDKQFATLADSGVADGLPRIRVSLLGSFNLAHTVPLIRMAALRRGLVAHVHVSPYGQYRQEILDASSELARFRPDAALLAIHANDLSEPQRCLDEWRHYWTRLKEQGAVVIHQTIVNPGDTLFGHFDSSVAATPYATINRVNACLREQAHQDDVLILDVDNLASLIGKKSWNDLPFWFAAKDAVPRRYAVLYGDHVARLLAALRGLSAKALVLDLDGTLWSGVVGDDGVEGIALGQGSPVGEAHLAFQRHVKQLKERGVLLAVCSKNDQETAERPFKEHSETVLRLEDFSVFVANWEHKPGNISSIAAQLNIGLDALVCVDDNPVERDLIRTMLPEVRVPELPDDPAYFSSVLIDAGYFEAVSFTAEDADRTAQYQAEAKRRSLAQRPSFDIDGYLKDLGMVMTASTVTEASVQRVTQLINKSNQFNLTARRYTETQVRQFMTSRDVLPYQFQLRDRFGDYGIIGVVIGRTTAPDEVAIDTWLMSCRVLGRQVEQEILNTLVRSFRHKGITRITGEYIPTAKNGLVRDHYSKLGFQPARDSGHWVLPVRAYREARTCISVQDLA